MSSTPRKLVCEPVLLLRRLILLTASIFIVDPILKLYPVGVLLVLFGFHDYIVRPFTDHNLNVFQIVSYGLLIVLTTQNSTHFGHSQTIWILHPKILLFMRWDSFFYILNFPVSFFHSSFLSVGSFKIYFQVF